MKARIFKKNGKLSRSKLHDWNMDFANKVKNKKLKKSSNHKDYFNIVSN